MSTYVHDGPVDPETCELAGHEWAPMGGGMEVCMCCEVERWVPDDEPWTDRRAAAMRRPRLLDLFCCAGGASVGYHRAGFEVHGVDSAEQPDYPFAFTLADALEFVAHHGHEYDAIHASPPCQVNSSLRHLWQSREHPDLIAPTRDLLVALGKPYVIENVVGADLVNPVLLCGSMFYLGAGPRQLRRHRLFEANWGLTRPGPCVHVGQPVGVYGSGGGKSSIRGYKGNRDEYRESMGIDWTTKQRIAQAIPPAYTEFVGRQLRKVVVRDQSTLVLAAPVLGDDETPTTREESGR